MAKDTFYFSHDYNARSDSKIKQLMVKHGMTGYGVYWALIEDLYNNENELPVDFESLAFNLHADVEIVKSVVQNFNLFVFNGGFFGSKSVQTRLENRDLKSKKASKSARKRWGNPEKDANAMQTHTETHANASQNTCERIDLECDGNAIKERKGNESKEKEIIKIGEDQIFFRLGTETIIEKLSEYFLKHHKIFAERWFMQKKLKPPEIEKIFHIMDSEYIGYNFSDHNHLINVFKKIQEKKTFYESKSKTGIRASKAGYGSLQRS